IGWLQWQCGAVTPQAARGGIDLPPRYAWQRGQQQWGMTWATPTRLVEREGLAGAGVEIAGWHAGSVRGRVAGLKGARSAAYALGPTPGSSGRLHLFAATPGFLLDDVAVGLPILATVAA